MASIETVFLPFESTIKIEPEESQESACMQEPRQSIDEVLRAKANIFSDPVVRLHRIDSTSNTVEVPARKDKTSFDSNSKRRKLLWSAKAKCPICDKRVVFLRAHMKTHKTLALEARENGGENPSVERIHHQTNDKKVSCGVCQRQYKNLLQLRKHCRQKKHALPKTEKNFTTAEAPTERGTVSCKNCDKKFSSLRSLNRHIDCFHKNPSKNDLEAHMQLQSSKTDCETKLGAFEESTGKERLKDKADKACIESLNAEHAWVEGEIFADYISRTESERTGDAAEDEAPTVNHKTQSIEIPLFEEALMYIELLLFYCTDKFPDGIKHLLALKEMLEQKHLKESKKILEVLPATTFDEDEWLSVDDPLESDDDHFPNLFIDLEAQGSEVEIAEKSASNDEHLEPKRSNFTRENRTKHVRIVRMEGTDDQAAILAKKGNEGLRSVDPHTCCICRKVVAKRHSLRDHLRTVHRVGMSDSHEAFIPDAKKPAEALAMKGNEGVKCEDPHTCCICQKVFKFRAALEIHLDTIHLKTEKFCCDHCPKFFFAKFSIIDHIRDVHSKEFNGEICNAQFASLQNHKLEERNEDISEPKENKKNNITDHVKRAYKSRYRNDPAAILALKGNEGLTNLKPHTCCLCRKVLVNRNSLRTRLKMIHKDHLSYLEMTDSQEASMQDNRQPEVADALALEGNEGLKNNDPHTCCVCQKVLTSRATLRLHLNTVHIQSKAFVCDYCPKFYFNKETLKNHMKKHGQKVFACTVCDYKTAIRLRFEEHELTHAAKVECPICSKQVSFLKTHMRTHEPEKLCPICLKMFSKYSLSRHLKTHEERIYVCEKCSECFESKRDLQRHDQRQHQGYLHVCHCGAAFKSEINLRFHQRTNHGKQKTCEVCQEKFTSIVSFRCHWKKWHRLTHGMHEINKMRVLKPSGAYICDRCGATSKTRFTFLLHNLKKHQTLFCDLCRRTFYRKDFLIQHLNGDHLNLRPFICKVCNHRTFLKDDLKRHMKSHGPKTECKVCHKLVTNVYRHSQTHIKVGCPICHETYSKSSIAKHIKIHKRNRAVVESPMRKTEKRRYQPVKVECPICHRLIAKNSLEHHLTTHEPLKREDCVASFENKHDLSR